MATNAIDGKSVTKTFRCDGDGDDDKAEALRLAKEWLATEQ